ncbi:putative addiction module antidote protein [Desulfoprunum benzoelyticum]|uniref:Putative addiction module antidote protein n=2 Tax=Desulfoprunum benzoelyticum TaxID=1506996 RepID=A0A840V1Z0_9BACT|nr:addiction module antidote protein [Desulfoprunum benzoelyticum]MBB5347181.1 putative addiction module antidote protein [Desulfoprunum benzoelyticum]
MAEAGTVPEQGLNMTEKFTRWDASDHLKTEEDIMAYFEACLDDDPGDGSLVRAALGDIAKAGNMSKLAREIGLSREVLYRALSTDGNPEFATIMKVIKGLGLRLHAGRTRHSNYRDEG